MIDKSIFNINSIIIDTDFSTQEQVFSHLSKYFVKNSYCTNYEEIKVGFFEREKEGSTAFTDGIGIPHSKVNSIIQPGIYVIKNKNGINWDSLDGKETNFFIALAIPNLDSNTLHLKMLSSVARKLVDKEFKKNILNAKTKEEIFELLSLIEII
ncbi:PTS sugar transporter subunit IIA [Spiroplasma culicicola]|uniref:PTS system fructose-specific IIA component n=1 Tax=Spiroplasma culicicola AES-1 TaxID=1276246 RepID=W6A8C9_9MOLU|nr:PTS sugar transporter subunit IIA [Spiroplasma culicicola]AHI53252.1 PTS system fructose-specific IIA component [Spiroplasma culicicola AES-1]